MDWRIGSGCGGRDDGRLGWDWTKDKERCSGSDSSRGSEEKGDLRSVEERRWSDRDSRSEVVGGPFGGRSAVHHHHHVRSTSSVRVIIMIIIIISSTTHWGKLRQCD